MPSRSMKKILLVDDDEDLVEMLRLSLKSNDFDVHVHTTSSNIPDVVKYYKPDLILLDIRLEDDDDDKSGMNICRELKRNYNIPILLISADTRKGKAFKDFDADGFIVKPFTTDELISAITQHLDSPLRGSYPHTNPV